MKLPAFQFYPADWRKDPGVQALNRHDRSVWFDMLCIMHESEERGVLMLAGRPMPEAAMASILNLDKQILSNTLTTLLTYGVARRRQEDGAIFSKRMVQDEKLIQIRRDAGKRGGNPVLLKQNPTTPVKQNPTPSSSSSSSKFIKPSSDDLREYGQTLNPPFTDALRFFDFYESKGWKVGKQPMKDWKAAVRNWQRNNSPKTQSADDEIARQKARQ